MTVKVHGAAKIVNATPEVKAEVTMWKWKVQLMTRFPSVRWARLCSTRAAPWNWCLVEFEKPHADLKQLLSATLITTPSTAASSSQPMTEQDAGHSQEDDAATGGTRRLRPIPSCSLPPTPEPDVPTDRQQVFVDALLKWPDDAKKKLSERDRAVKTALPPTAFGMQDEETDFDYVAEAVRSMQESPTISTCFSGIGAPETGADLVSSTFNAGKVACLSAIEWLPESQKELIVKPNGPECIFGNITQFFKNSIQGFVQSMEKKPSIALMDIMKPVIMSENSVQPYGWCLKHHRMCKLQVAARHFAGTACTDHSDMGDRQGLEGKTTLFFLCWIALRLMLQEAVIVQENVCNFQVTYLTMFLDKYYYVDSVKECSTNFGWPGVRLRQWVVMRHRTKTLAFRSPLNVFTQLFHRKEIREEEGVEWETFFCADEEKVKAELAWAAGRPGSRSHKRESPDGTGLAITDSNAFEWALTETEYTWLQTYKINYPGRCYSLNQNPIGFATKSPSQKVLHTVIKNCHLIWGDSVHERLQKLGTQTIWKCDRWLIPEELLFSQGFPVFPWMRNSEHASWTINRNEFGLTERSRHAVAGQAGNTMNLNVVGIIFLFTHLAIEFPCIKHSKRVRDLSMVFDANMKYLKKTTGAEQA